MFRRWKHSIAVLMILVLMTTVLAACGGSQEDSVDAASDDSESKETIVFAAQTWESALIHSNAAQFIVENGYGYKTDTIQGGTVPLVQGLVNGEIQVIMEMWIDNSTAYDEALANGDIIKLGVNFPDTDQGWYVPTYVIEGDPERGIEPMAPDLESVEDLPKYWELFKDPADPSKGLLVNCMVGWKCADTNETKLKAYGLDEYYNVLTPGSNAALAASLVSAYKQGEPWLGYYWEPTWVFAKYDLTKLKEPEQTEECTNSIAAGETDVACAYKKVDVYVGVSDDFKENGPEEIVTFLENYQSSLEATNDVLLYLEENEATPEEAAIWMLKQHEDEWTQWVPDDVAAKVKAALEEASTAQD